MPLGGLGAPWLKHPSGPDGILPQMKFEMKLSNAVFNIPETGETHLQEIT